MTTVNDQVMKQIELMAGVRKLLRNLELIIKDHIDDGLTDDLNLTPENMVEQALQIHIEMSDDDVMVPPRLVEPSTGATFERLDPIKVVKDPDSDRETQKLVLSIDDRFCGNLEVRKMSDGRFAIWHCEEGALGFVEWERFSVCPNMTSAMFEISEAIEQQAHNGLYDQE